MSLGLGSTVVVAVTATLAAVGAAAIPSAGLVTMLMVLQVRARAARTLPQLRFGVLCAPGSQGPWPKAVTMSPLIHRSASPLLHRQDAP